MKIPGLFYPMIAFCCGLFCPHFLSAQCTAPSGLTAANPSISGATLNWTENGTATLWDIEIQPAGTPATGTPTVAGVSKPYVWTGGSQATGYQFWVRSQCTAGGSSAWAGPVTFLTAFDNAAPACVNLSVPLEDCLAFPITVSGAPGTTLGSNVYLDKVEIIAYHDWNAELDIFLETPTGVQIELSTDNGGGSGNNYGNDCPTETTTFGMWAATPITAGIAPFIGSYLPEGNFATFNDANPNGTWKLIICDDGPLDQGSLRFVRLHFTECARPTALTATNPTPTGATLYWTENSSATLWDIEIQPAGTPATGIPTVSGVPNPFIWTGGSQATSYQYWVRSQCPTSGFSAWAGPGSFQTDIDNAAPVCLDFALPSIGCSNTIPIAVSGAPGTTLGTDVFLDKVEIILHHNWASELSIYLESPSGSQVELSSENGSLNDNYGNNCPSQTTTFAMWATTPITAGSPPFVGTYLPEGNFITLNGTNPNGDWKLVVCDGGGGTTGSLKYVRLHFTTCPRPTALAATSPTVNGATLDWMENGTATTWDLEFQPVGTPATGTPTVAGTNKPYTWTGGSQGTEYQVWLRSNCGGSASEWFGPGSFITLVDNAAPACLSFGLPTNGCPSPMLVAVSGAPGNMLGTDVFLDQVELIVHHSVTSELDIYLETPSGIQIELSTDNGGLGDNYGGTCSSQPTVFAPWASTSITAGAAPFIGTYLPEGSFNSFNGANPNGNWKLFACDDTFSPTGAGSLKYVKLDFTTCPRPNALSATSPTVNGATLDWTENGTATAWDLEFLPVGTPATGIPTVAGINKPYTWTGGSQATEYQVWLRSNCGGSASAWIGPVSFTTLIDNAAPACFDFSLPTNGCPSPALIAVSGAPGSLLGTDVFLDQVELIVHHSITSELDIYLETPSGIQIELSTDNGGSGDNYGGTCSSQPTVFAPWASTSVTAGAAPFIGSYVPEGSFASFNGANPNGNWKLFACDDAVSVAGAGSLKYAKLTFAACPRPSALAATSPTANGATLNWTENGTATLWDIEFQPVGTPATGIPTVSGVTQPYTWTGGAQATSYQAWVRSACGGSGSAWTGPVSFTTPFDNADPTCANFTLPSSGCPSPTLISVSGVTGSALGTDVFLDRVEIIIHHGNDSELDIYLESPSGIQIDLSSDNGSIGDNYGGTCSSQTTVFAPWATTSVTAGAAPFIGNYIPEGSFTSFNGANPNGNWKLIPCDDGPTHVGSLKFVKLVFAACPRPTAPVAASPTPFGATLDWTENGSATTWDIEFQPAGTPATGIPTVSGVSKPYTWTGGTQATSYQAWVRSSCGGSSEWAGPATFQTTIDNAAPACVNFTLPAANACAWYPLTVSGAPGNALGTDVFLDKVEVIVHHTQANELDIYLETPSNIQVELSTDNGGSGDNYGNVCPGETTTFAMWASTPVTAGAAPFVGTYRPEGNFDSFNGANPNGDWELAVCDDGNTAVGSLKYVRLYFSNVLPVQLASFTATSIEGRQVRLDWATESEQNSDWFAVERAADGLVFSEIGRVRAAGSSAEKRAYSVWDEHPLPGTNYYRLRQVDLDGGFDFSPVRSAWVGLADPKGWKVYPNPTSGSFFVETNGENGVVFLKTTSGQTVWSAPVSTENKPLSVPADGLPAGLYWIQFHSEAGIFTTKLVVE